MVTILTKEHTRLRVKEWRAPITDDKILGSGIDVMTMPDSHLCCGGCGKHTFEVWIHLDNHRIEVGCMSCGAWQTRLLVPLDIDLRKRFGQGRFECFRHKRKGFVIIKNTDVLNIGCEKCKTEVSIHLNTKSNLVMA